MATWLLGAESCQTVMLIIHYIFIMKIVHEVQMKAKREKKVQKRCKKLVRAQTVNQHFNITESEGI